LKREVQKSLQNGRTFLVRLHIIVDVFMKSKVITFLLLVLFSFSAASTEKELDENLQYFKEIYTQANAQYEYEKELGLDIDAVVSEIKQSYLEQCKPDNPINSDILVTCYGTVLEKVQKVPNNHFAVYNQNHFYGAKYWLWNYSLVVFEKRNDDYYCIQPGFTKIKKCGKYTGDISNLFKLPDNEGKGKELYRFGILDENWIEEGIVSVDGNDYSVPLYGLPSHLHDESGIDVKTTDKTFYICFNNFTFFWDDANKYRELQNTLNEYLKLFDDNEYENIIVDLRGNIGGMERSFYPFMERLAAGRDYGKQRGFKKKLDSLYNGRKRYYSDYINQNFLEAMKANPGSYDRNEEEKLKKSKGFYFEQYNHDYYDFDCNFKGKLIILMNYCTASAAELFITESYMFDNVILLGSNSRGCFDFGGKLVYKLPNSDISIELCSDSYKEMKFTQENPHWHGDYKGFYPDYWVTDYALLKTLVYLTSDRKLKRALKGG